MVARNTQQIVEVLGQDTTFRNARVTQQIVEVLGQDTAFRAARISQQIVEVLGQDTAFTRAIFTSQNVEVLGTLQPDPPTDTITLTDSVTFTQPIHSFNLTDSLTLSDSAINTMVRKPSLTDTISFVSTGSLAFNVYTRSNTDSITLTDTATFVHVYGLIDPITLTDTLAYTQVARQVLNIPRSDTLTFTDSVTFTKSTIFSDSFYPINDFVTVSHVKPVSITDSLTLTQSVTSVRFISKTDTLTITDTAVVAKSKKISDTLTLTDIVTKTKNKTNPTLIVDMISFSDRLNRQFNLSFTDTITLTDSQLSGFKYCTNNCNLTTYSPHIDYSNTSVTPMLGVSPIPLSSSCQCVTPNNQNIVYTYPAISPTMTLTLPAPDFNNHDTYTIKRITRVTRGNKLLTYRAPYWPKLKTLVYSFSYLTEQQKQDLLKFLYASTGAVIGLLDFENRYWQGTILNPSDAVTQSGRYVNSASIQFQGNQQ